MDHLTDDDDDLISDRTRRFLQTLALDKDFEIDDNEFVILSTGQVVGLKDIHRNAPKQKTKDTDDASSSRQLWNDFCCTNSMDDSASLVNRFFCTPISYARNGNPSYHAFVIITLVCWLVLYYQFRPHSREPKSKDSCSRRSKESGLKQNVCVEAKLQSQPSLPTATGSFKRKDDLADTDRNDVPDLVFSESLPNEKISLGLQPSTAMVANDTLPLLAAVAPQSSDHMESSQTVISIPSPKRTTIDDARHAVALVSMYEQACAEQGRVCDHGAALHWAAQQQKAETMLNARREEELRRYLWDHAQRTVDRSLSQNQHDETIAVSREDKDWLRKLQDNRDKCHAALICALYQSIIGAFLIVVSRPFMQVIYLWRTLSGSEMFCYDSGTSFDPKVSFSTSLSWYGRYTSYAYADSWTYAILGEAATCLAYSIGRAFNVFLGVSSLSMSSWVLRQLGFLELVQNLMKAAVLLLILSIYGWIPGHLMYRFLFCLGVIASFCYVMLRIKFHSIRTQFGRMNAPPHASVVSNSLEWFDDAKGMIQTIPVIMFGGLVLLVSL